jgi:hypothetical protein
MGRSSMRCSFLPSVVTYFLVPLQVQADNTEDLPVEKLPPAVATHIADSYTHAEVLRVQKVVENNKECYELTIRDEGEVLHLYASSDGRLLARKEDPFALEGIAGMLIGYALFLLLPTMAVGFFFRWLVQSMWPRKLSIVAEWISAWSAASAVIAIVLLSLATVPSAKDIPVIILQCVVWAGVSASLLEVIVLSLQSSRGVRPTNRAAIRKLCLVGSLAILFSIPVQTWRVVRTNEYFRALALRSPKPWGFLGLYFPRKANSQAA